MKYILLSFQMIYIYIYIYMSLCHGIRHVCMCLYIELQDSDHVCLQVCLRNVGCKIMCVCVYACCAARWCVYAAKSRMWYYCMYIWLGVHVFMYGSVHVCVCVCMPCKIMYVRVCVCVCVYHVHVYMRDLHVLQRRLIFKFNIGCWFAKKDHAY